MDVDTGAVLSSLLEILSGKPVPDIGSTKDHVANLESCFAFMRRENVLLLHIIQPQGTFAPFRSKQLTKNDLTRLSSHYVVVLPRARHS
jgi:hypothetical protein